VVIAVKVTTPGYTFPVAIERPLPGYADATAAAGQSFISGDGANWTDMTTLIADTDVCLKGYATAGAGGRGAGQHAAPTVSVRGGSAAAGSFTGVRFRLRSPDTTVTADVRFTLRTRRGKVLCRRTLHGVGVTAGHTWRVRVPAQRGAYVVSAVAGIDTGEVSRPATARLRVVR